MNEILLTKNLENDIEGNVDLCKRLCDLGSKRVQNFWLSSGM